MQKQDTYIVLILFIAAYYYYYMQNSKKHKNQSIMLDVGKGMGGLATTLATAPHVINAISGASVSTGVLSLLEPASKFAMMISGLGLMIGHFTGL